MQKSNIGAIYKLSFETVVMQSVFVQTDISVHSWQQSLIVCTKKSKTRRWLLTAGAARLETCF